MNPISNLKLDLNSQLPTQPEEQQDYKSKLSKEAQTILKISREQSRKESERYLALNQYIQTLSDAQIKQGGAEKIKEAVSAIKSMFIASTLDSMKYLPEDIHLTYASSLTFLIQELKEFQASNPLSIEEKKKLEEMIKSLEEAYWIAIDIDTIKGCQVRYEENETISERIKVKPREHVKPLFDGLINHLEDRLNTLKEGERLLIPGGTTDHAIIYEFIARQKDGQPTFTLRILNSGEGGDEHPKVHFFDAINPWARVKTYEINDIPLDHLISKSEGKNVLSELINKAMFKPKQSTIPLIGMLINFVRSVLNIYSIYRLIKVSIVNRGATINVNTESHKTQRLGSCARKAYNFWLKENLGQKTYQEYRIQATEMAIGRVHQLVQEKDPLQQKGLKIKSFAARWFRTCALARIYYYLKGETPDDVLIHLGHRVLERRKAKLERLKAAPAA